MDSNSMQVTCKTAVADPSAGEWDVTAKTFP